MNKNFRNKNKPTDILSFPLNRKIRILKKTYIGDIIISYDFIDKPKSQDLKLFKKKLIKTFIHGFLHLLGFNHIKDKDYKKMLKEEELIYQSVISKIKLKKKIYIELLVLVILGMITSLSLPPLNYLFINFFTYSFFHILNSKDEIT